MLCNSSHDLCVNQELAWSSSSVVPLTSYVSDFYFSVTILELRVECIRMIHDREVVLDLPNLHFSSYRPNVR